MTDTTSKGTMYDATGRNVDTLYNGTPIANSRLIVGFGFNAHRDGYNALYGDWSARWFGDPESGIIFHTQDNNTSTVSTHTGTFTLGHNTFEAGTPNPFNNRLLTDNYVRNNSIDVWHGFDVAGNVDVNVP